MKKILILLTFGLFLISSSCSKIKDIKTIKTDQHKNIPGTKLFIVQPEGFKMSQIASVSQKGNSASIVAIDFSSVNYNNCHELNITKEEFEKKGIKVLEYKEINVNEYPAKFAYIQGYTQDNPTAKSYYIVFGDSTFCTAIVGTFNDGDKVSQEQIKTSLETVFYDKTTTIDFSFRMDGFKLDDSKSTMKFATYVGGLGIFTKNGRNSENAYPMLTVNRVPNKGNFTVETLDGVSLNNLKSNGFSKISTKTKGATKTNGLNSYESINYGTMLDKEYLICIRTVSIDDYFVVLIGLANEDYDKSLAEIQQLSNTIQKKY